MSNVWENIVLVLIVYFVTSTIVAGIYYVIFNIKPSLKSVAYFYVTITFVGVIGMYIELSNGNKPNFMLIKSILTFCSVLIFSKVFYKVNTPKAAIATVLFAIIFAVGSSTSIFFLYMFNISFAEAKQSTILQIVVQGIMLILCGGILSILLLFKRFRIIPTEFRKNELRGFIVNLMLITMLCGTNAYFWNSIQNTILNSTIFVLNLSFLLIFLVVSIINLNTYVRLGNTNAELEVQRFYNTTMQTFIDEINRIKHNYNNTISILNGYVQMKKWDKLEHYLNEVNQDCLAINSLQTLMSLNIRNAAILGLLGAKMEYANKKNLAFNITTHNPIEQINSKMFLLCDVLGCLIDNAIEASADSREKYLELKIEEIDENFVFKLKNSFSEKPDINSIFNKGFSSKGENRGVGLWYVRDRITREKNLLLNTLIKDNVFEQELIVEKSKNLAV